MRRLILLVLMGLASLQIGSVQACPPWWTPGSFWWENHIHFEEYLARVWHPPIQHTHKGVEVTFTADTYVAIVELWPEEQNEEMFGHRGIMSQDGVLRFDFSAPIDHLQIHIGGDCGENPTAIPGLYCYDENDVLFTGDCWAHDPGWLRTHIRRASNCTTFGPIDELCPETETEFQWYFGQEYIPTGQLIHWCELISEGGREIFVGTMAFTVASLVPPPGGGAGSQ